MPRTFKSDYFRSVRWCYLFPLRQNVDGTMHAAEKAKRNEFATCARNYRPCFRENQPKRSFSIKWKRAFRACFRENWVYKFGHWMNSQPEYWKSLDIADFFFDRPALLNHAEMLRCDNILVRSPRIVYLLKNRPANWLVQTEREIVFPHKCRMFKRKINLDRRSPRLVRNERTYGSPSFLPHF